MSWVIPSHKSTTFVTGLTYLLTFPQLKKTCIGVVQSLTGRSRTEGNMSVLVMVLSDLRI